MAKPKVFIDGQQGSTGLRIRALLGRRSDLQLLSIDEAKRKDRDARGRCLNEADFAILCLPDAASAEAVELVGSGDTRLIDTSSARRMESGWTYGLPELTPEQRKRIEDSGRVANPGCYPQTFILGVRPLVEAGILDAAAPLTVNAVSGYSGGGRQMVDAYRNTPPGSHGDAGQAFCVYGLDGTHKHLPEMQAYSLVSVPPLFVPAVDHSFCGMLVSIPLPAQQLNGHDAGQVYNLLNRRYAREPLLSVYSPAESVKTLRDGKFLDLDARAGSNGLDLMVFDRADAGVIIVGRLDNLGKGAAGNAVQCLNIMLGVDERLGLEDTEVTRLAS